MKNRSVGHPMKHPLFMTQHTKKNLSPLGEYFQQGKDFLNTKICEYSLGFTCLTTTKEQTILKYITISNKSGAILILSLFMNSGS